MGPIYPMAQKVGFPHGHSENCFLPFNFLFHSFKANVAAVGFVNQDGQVLISFNTKRKVWDIPQGGVSTGESNEMAAVREVKEEIGIDLDPEELRSISTFETATSIYGDGWQTELFVAIPEDAERFKHIHNCEPEKNTSMYWCSPSQIPIPRGMSLKMLLIALGVD